MFTVPKIRINLAIDGMVFGTERLMRNYFGIRQKNPLFPVSVVGGTVDW